MRKWLLLLVLVACAGEEGAEGARLTPFSLETVQPCKWTDTAFLRDGATQEWFVVRRGDYQEGMSIANLAGASLDSDEVFSGLEKRLNAMFFRAAELRVHLGRILVSDFLALVYRRLSAMVKT